MEKKKVFLIIGGLAIAGVALYVYRKNKSENVNNDIVTSESDSGKLKLEVDKKLVGSIGGKLEARRQKQIEDLVKDKNESLRDRVSSLSANSFNTKTNPCGTRPFFPTEYKKWRECMDKMKSSGSTSSGFNGYVSHNNYSDVGGMLNEIDL